MSKPPLCPRTPDGASPQRASGDCRGQAEALATAMRRVRDSDFDVVRLPVRWTERVARLLAASGAARDVLGRRFAECRAAARSLVQPIERYRTVLSRKHRCVWIRLPKAASSSIMAGLLASDPECEVFGTTSAEFYALRPEARDWFTFAFVRHPFDRALSFWSEIHFASRVYTSRTSPQMYKRAAKLRRCYGLAETLDFDSYCDWLRTPYAADAYTDRHVASLSKPIGDVSRSRRRPLDFIGRVETLEADCPSRRGGRPCPQDIAAAPFAGRLGGDAARCRDRPNGTGRPADEPQQGTPGGTLRCGLGAWRLLADPPRHRRFHAGSPVPRNRQAPEPAPDRGPFGMSSRHAGRLGGC